MVRAGAGTETAAIGDGDKRKSLLLFRAGSFPRIAIPLASVARLEQIPSSSIEQASGRAVVQYRNQVLPLISVPEMFDGIGETPEMLAVVVYRDGAISLGLVVDEILDIVEEEVTSRCGTSRAGLMGSAVVGGRVTDFLDIDTIAAQTRIGASDSLARLERALAPTGSREREEVAR